jgi:predicted DNA-binding transcriptional regulator YafY
LEDEELRALLMTQARAIAEPRLAAFAERALTKLTASLPAPLRERAASVRKRLHVDTAGWFGREERLAALPTVQDAVAAERMLSFRYHPPGRDAADRCVGPLGLVAKGTVWYLVASAPAGLRTYRVSRIERAEVLEAPFVRPAGFDLARYWEEHAHALRATRRYIAELRTTPAVAESVRAWCRVLPAKPEDVPDAEGVITLRVDFEDEGHACFVALGLGQRAEVVAPPALVARVAAEIAVMARRVKNAAAADILDPWTPSADSTTASPTTCDIVPAIRRRPSTRSSKTSRRPRR